MSKETKTKKRFSGWNAIWIIPLAVALALLVTMYLIPALERVNTAKVDGSADWMAALADDMYLSEVVLPGTHDSATKGVQLAFFSKCQALTIREQLEAGYRYLDIRLGDGDGMPLMHGFTHCTDGGFPWSKNLLLESVLADCRGFLKAHPTETIVFCVKHEHGDASDAEFSEALAEYVDEEPELWYDGDTLPTVGEARGKIVLMKRFDDGGRLPGLTFNWADQGGFDDPSKHTESNPNPAFLLFVQDRFEYEAEEKWDAFKNGMGDSEVSDTAVSLNFLSTKGHAKYGHPYKYARALNDVFLTENPIPNGWIAVDFGSAALADRIYGANFN